MTSASNEPYLHLKLQPPDVVWLDTHSEGSQMMSIVGELRRRAEAGGPYYLVVDFAEMKRPDMEKGEREEAQKLIDPSWILGAVYLNATMPVRLMIKVFNLAMFLVGKADFQSEFVTSREEALAAVDRLRTAREARSAK